MEKKMFSASEIAGMGIPGMPTSRDNVRMKAEREKWPCEERTGVGGTRKVYAVPDHYFVSPEAPDAAPGIKEKGASYVKREKVVPIDIDREQRILDIGKAVDQWLLSSNLIMDLDKKYLLIQLLYRYFEREKQIDNEKLTEFIRKLA